MSTSPGGTIPVRPAISRRIVDQNRDNPFFLCLWHYAVHAPFQAKEELIGKYRGRKDPRGEQNCPTMAAMIKSMDESLGRILDKLDELDIADDTIIILMSDNGGNMYDRVEGETPTNNAPLRGGKATLYEGGTREPCIIVWPGVVEPGSRCSEIISSIDFYPTMLEMAGVTKKQEQRVDGVSIVPLLRGAGKLDREAIFCHFPHYIPATKNLPGTYVRKGDWKLIRFYGEGPDRSPGYELYNLRNDIGETNNLAAQMPEKVRELDALITRHLEAIGAIVPILNPKYRPTAFNPITDEPIEGWKPAGTCDIRAKDGVLHVTSFGRDPYFLTNEVPEVSGPVVFRMRMKSRADGAGQVFWGTAKALPFHRSRSVVFAPQHDGRWREYALDLPVDGALRALRLDPCAAPGEIEIDWIRLCAPNGAVLRSWDF